MDNFQYNISHKRKRSNRRILFLIFITFSLFLLYFSKEITQKLPLDRTEILFIGFIYILLGLLILYKFFNKRNKNIEVYFSFNDHGIKDKTSKWSHGFISWSDIKELKFSDINGAKCIFIYVNDPKKYLYKNSFWMKKFLMQILHIQYNTPIIIQANDIEGDLDELRNNLIEKHQRFSNNIASNK